MVIYYVVLIYLLILGLLFYRYPHSHSKKLFLFLAFAGLFLLMVVRAETVGTDVALYGGIFRRIASKNTWQGLIEAVDNAPIYSLLNKGVSIFGDYRLMLAVIACIILSSVAIYIYNFSDDVFLSTYCFVTLFFFFHACNISRQFLGIALVLLALCFRKRRHIIVCVALYILALGIHSLSLVALPLLILNPENITPKRFRQYMTMIPIAVLLAVFGMPRAVAFFSSIFNRYAIYLTSKRVSVYNTSSGSVILLALFYCLIVLLAVVIQSNSLKGVHLECKEQSQISYLIIAVAVGGLTGLLAGYYEAISRILYFYQIHAICLIPNVFFKLRQERFNYLIYLGLLLLLLVPFTVCLLKNIDMVVPFVPMWA